MLLSVFVEYDIAVSAIFYNPTLATPWFLSNSPPWNWLYHYGEYPTLSLAIASGGLYLADLRWQRWKRYRRIAVFLVLAIALGPGGIVNGLLKPLWGRPRPRHLVAFGGSAAYQPWWQPGGLSHSYSFPSGHAAMGEILLAGLCLIPSARGVWLRVLVFSTALAYGTAMGVARVVQGGHFASDVFAAGGLMCGTVMVLYIFFPPEDPVVQQRPP